MKARQGISFGSVCRCAIVCMVLASTFARAGKLDDFEKGAGGPERPSRGERGSPRRLPLVPQ